MIVQNGRPDAEIPAFYEKLLVSPGVSTLSVLSKDGSIQSTLVWADYDGECIKLNMLVDSPKEVSLRERKLATILKSDPDDENQYISLRCVLQAVEPSGAIEHLDEITRRNTNNPSWYGHIEPEDSPTRQRRVVVYLKPIRVYYT